MTHGSNEFDAHSWLQEIALYADPVQAMRRVVQGEPDDWQKELLHADDPLTLVLASRGIGKSTTVAVDSFLFAETHPNTTTLIVAPVARQALELYRNIRHVRRVLPVKTTEVRETQTDLELSNQSRIVVLPGDSDRIRAFRAHRIYLDEAARLSDEGWAALIPMLLESGRLIAISTPAGRKGFMFDAWQEGRGKCIIAKSVDLPRMAAIVERDKKLMSSAAFRTEHLLEWAGSGQAFFDYDTVTNAFQEKQGALKLQCLS